MVMVVTFGTFSVVVMFRVVVMPIVVMIIMMVVFVISSAMRVVAAIVMPVVVTAIVPASVVKFSKVSILLGFRLVDQGKSHQAWYYQDEKRGKLHNNIVLVMFNCCDAGDDRFDFMCLI
jgi:hypothetical protein